MNLKEQQKQRETFFTVHALVDTVTIVCTVQSPHAATISTSGNWILVRKPALMTVGGNMVY